ncbi:MAG: hypothetical protein JW867_04520 [Candidatus Omnitrophica bacterium]|nr:hypothetical protein [Candidatus Omnitrophota bacterium]
MKINASKIKIFRIKNRKGYGAVCNGHLTEGRTLNQVYDRMLKALRRSKIEVNGRVSDLKRLVKQF